MSDISEKIFWITGASSGIGEALAYELSRKGARIVISARRKEELERVKENCEKIGNSRIQILPLDLGKPDTLNIIAEAAIQMFGHIDVLVNNGGISQRSLGKETTMAVFRQLMEINYFGTITLTKSLIPHFIARGSGHFVTVTSVTGLIGTPYRTGYAASKHALHGFFDSLRAELWKDNPNIFVTLICPGWTNTNLSIVALTGDGSPQNKKDDTHEHGLRPEYLAQKIVEAIQRKKRQVVIAGWKESSAVFVNHYFPSLFAKIVRNAKVK